MVGTSTYLKLGDLGINWVSKNGQYGRYPLQVKMGNIVSNCNLLTTSKMVGIHCMVKKLVIWWISTTY